MKKILLVFCLMTMAVGVFAQPASWLNPMRRKVNFKDSTNFVMLPLINTADSVSTRAYARSVATTLTGAVLLADSVEYLNGYMTRFAGVTGLASKINVADSGVYAGGYVTPTALDAGLALQLSIADTATAFGPYALDAELDVLEASVYDTIEISSVVPMLADTVPLVVFGGGSGNEADTAVFTTSTIYGSFRNAGSDTIVVTGLNAVMGDGTSPLGTDTLDIDICWSDTLNAIVPTKLNTTALGINSTTVGTVDTAFDNAKIPPGVRVWMKTPAVVTGRKPNYVEVTLYGYKIPTY